MTEEQKAKLRKKTMQDAMKQSQLALRYFGEQSETAFSAFKAISIAEAVVNTAKAAISAYQAMASIPYVGPALGAAAAAAAIAFGMAQVSQIRSMEPGGSGGGSGGVSAPGSVGTYPASPTTGFPEIGQQEQQLGTTIIIEGDVIGDDMFIDHLVERINEAGDERNVTIRRTQYATSLS
jgi:hypothetical protein